MENRHSEPTRPPDGDWQEVWECPHCGQQVAAGVRSPDAPTVTLSKMKCGMGHAPVEMEQRLPRSMPFGPDAIQP